MEEKNLYSIEIEILGMIKIALYSNYVMRVCGNSKYLYTWRRNKCGRYQYKGDDDMWRELLLMASDHKRLDDWLAEITMLGSIEE